jgi:hypothetical protein
MFENWAVSEGDKIGQKIKETGIKYYFLCKRWEMSYSGE